MARILLVDDDISTRELYEELFKGEGFEVVVQTNGEEGLAEAIKGGFNLMLIDVLMPKKDGVTFLKEYQTLRPQNPNGPIIMLTAVAEDKIIKSCLELGATGFLIKSELTPDEVIKEVKVYLSSPTT